MEESGLKFNEYEYLVEQTSDLIQCVDGNGHFAYVNGAWKQKLGYTLEEVKGLSLWDIIHADSKIHCKSIYQKVVLGESIDIIEAVFVTKDGNPLYVEGSLHCRFGDDGKVISTYGIFRDVTVQKLAVKEEQKQLLQLNNILKQFLAFSQEEVDYQKIADDMLLLSEATYVGFNVFEENGKDYTTVGLSGIQKNIEKAFDILGFYIIGKKWAYDPVRAEKIKDKNVIYFKSLYELTGETIPREAVFLISNMFNLGQIVIIKIMKEEKMLGDFTLLMIKGQHIKNEKMLENYASQVGLFLEKKKTEENLKNSEEKYRLLITQMQQGLAVHEIICDPWGNPIDYRFISMNKKFQEQTGLEADATIGKTVLEVLPNTEKYWIETYGKVALTGEHIQFEKYSIEMDKWFKLSAYSPRIGEFAVIVDDITAQKRMEEEKREKQNEIEYLSYHDSLTGLYNRRYMENAMKCLDKDSNLPFTIMVLDVNGLKLTNDAFGHEMGDRLLKVVADILTKVCSDKDIIGRIGGDEFAILFPKTNENYAEIMKQKIIATASTVKLESVIVSLAIGYSVKINKEESIENINRIADSNMYKNKIKYGKLMRSQTIETVLMSINNKYDQEQIHTERVSQYCEAIAKNLNFSEKETYNLKTAGILHDIGKIIVPPELLNKPEKLSKEEYELVKRHLETGYQILRSVDEYSALAETVLYHHERWDGKGYPQGLKGEKIPLGSRIIAVADAYEAMTATRPYQKKRTKAEALEELEKCAGTQFDPEIIKVFVEKVL